MSADPDRDLAEARTAAAAERRRRQRRSLRILEEETTLVSLLTETARRGDEATLDTTWGSRHHGHIVRVSTEVVVLEPGATSAAGEPAATSMPSSVILRHEAIAAFSIRPGAGSSPLPSALATGAGAAPTPVTLVEILAELADREAVVAIRAGAVTMQGRLRSVGRDVATLSDGPRRPVRYVRVDSVSEISVSSLV